MPLMNIFTFLTFTRPLAIPSDVSVALLKRPFRFIAIHAEEGYSILTETSTKVFKSVTTNFLFLIISMPDYNYGIFNTTKEHFNKKC